MRVMSDDGRWTVTPIRRDGRELLQVTKDGYYEGEAHTVEALEVTFPGLRLAECHEE